MRIDFTPDELRALGAAAADTLSDGRQPRMRALIDAKVKIEQAVRALQPGGDECANAVPKT